MCLLLSFYFNCHLTDNDIIDIVVNDVADFVVQGYGTLWTITGEQPADTMGKKDKIKKQWTFGNYRKSREIGNSKINGKQWQDLRKRTDIRRTINNKSAMPIQSTWIYIGPSSARQLPWRADDGPI